MVRISLATVTKAAKAKKKVQGDWSIEKDND
jgi:hypothetical protein